MEQLTYKTIGPVELKLHIFRPTTPATGNRCELVSFSGKPPGSELYHATIAAMDRFLTALGFLPA